MESDKKPLKILLSAYACEPEKGSEPGVGWQWAKGLADLVDLHVLTREDNRLAIEQKIKNSLEGEKFDRTFFHYHDLSPFWKWLKKKRLLPTMAYYILWQWSVSKKFNELANSVDVVHHLTFCTLLCPGFWRLTQSKFVIGPVGAPQVNSHYISLFGNRACLQRLRGSLLLRLLRLPWLRRTLETADAIVPANNETKQLLQSQGIHTKDVMLDTGCPDINKEFSRSYEPNSIRLIYAGTLERRKGLELALRALAEVNSSTECNWTFSILGEGPDRKRLETLAAKLKINERVNFLGAVPRAKIVDHFSAADTFLFTSIRDTSGGVNLEAMSCELPIICIAHQGVADITDDSCAIRIEPGSVTATIRDLAKGIISLANSPEKRLQMGLNARKRATKKFSWREKFEHMMRVYREVLTNLQ